MGQSPSAGQYTKSCCFSIKTEAQINLPYVIHSGRNPIPSQAPWASKVYAPYVMMMMINIIREQSEMIPKVGSSTHSGHFGNLPKHRETNLTNLGGT